MFLAFVVLSSTLDMPLEYRACAWGHNCHRSIESTIAMWIIILLVLTAVGEQLSAQPQLRLEKLGLAPYIGNVRVLSGRVYMQSFDGVYVFDENSRSWVSLGQQSKLMVLSRDMTEHANGLVVVHVPAGTLRFQPKTNEFDLESGVFHQYQFVHSDSVVGAIQSGGESSVRFVWKRWPSLEVIRTDTVGLGGEYPFSGVIPCSDGSVLTMSSRVLVRFRYDGAPEVIGLGDHVLNGHFSYYVDSSQTHIALHSDRGVLLSDDQFRSWRVYGDSSVSTYARLHLTSDTNVIVAIDRGLLTRFNSDLSQVDTLLIGSYTRGNVSASADVVVVAAPDSLVFIRAASVSREHAGLQERCAQYLYAVNDGLVATSGGVVLVHPSGEQWSTCPLEKIHSPFEGGTMGIVPSGGSSIDDFWLSAYDTWAVHVRPRTSILKSDVFFPNYGNNGFQPSRDQWYFTVLYALEMDCGSNQVVWVSGNSPIRTLLCKNDLRYLMAFNERDIVAFSLGGSLWRTVDGDPARWSQQSIPVLKLRPFPRMITKGNHGLLTDARTRLWTHDAGLSWESSIDTIETYSTLTRTGTIISARIQGDSNATLSIDVLINGVTSRFASVTSDLVDFARNPIQDIAFDDIERRLYITTTYFTASIGMDEIVSVIDQPHVEFVSCGMQLGIYDLFGRRIAADETEVDASGLYIAVKECGAQKILIQR